MVCVFPYFYRKEQNGQGGKLILVGLRGWSPGMRWPCAQDAHTDLREKQEKIGEPTVGLFVRIICF